MSEFSKTNYLMVARRSLLAASIFIAAFGSAHAEIGLSAAKTENQNTSVEKQNVATVRAAFDRWREGSNVFTDLLAPNVVWTIHGSGAVAGTYRSLKDFTERGSGPLVDRLTGPVIPEVRHIFADGDIVIVRFNGSATTTSGKPYRNQFVWLFRMKDGSVVEAEAFLDLVAYQQVVDNNEPRAD